MTKFRLPGLVAAWTAAVLALGWSNASACQGPGFHGSIFFSEQGLPEVSGTIAAYVEIVDRPPPGTTGDNPQASYAVAAHVTKVVRGKIDQEYVTLDAPASSCDHPPRAGEKGLIIGYAKTDADSNIRIRTLSESRYGFDFRMNERTRACPMPQAAADALIIATAPPGERYIRRSRRLDWARKPEPHGSSSSQAAGRFTLFSAAADR